MIKCQKKSGRSHRESAQAIVHVKEAKYLGDYRLSLSFDDGTMKQVDLWPHIKNRKGVFEALKEKSFFAKLRVDSESGTITWPNQVDWAPEVLYRMGR